ncbi:hypothetical protein [Echinicola rosea]|uniref:Uncharacterized protein n=1 Tax=Echinicola rosea TaxID=1807691 RepID=A0ABQ1UYF5_9BACT|nr:hypothetical protein [Echinicola rosea]GGF28325.1 hypothetical protein GCM10011339_15660 [Echinicola rosea]
MANNGHKFSFADAELKVIQHDVIALWGGIDLSELVTDEQIGLVF